MRTRAWMGMTVLLCLVGSGSGRGDQPQWPGKYEILPIDAAGRTEARAINDAGMVAGVAFGKDGGLRGFVYYPKGHAILATGQIVPAPKGVPEIRELRGFRTPNGAAPVRATAFEPLSIDDALFVAGTCWGAQGEKQLLIGTTDRSEAEVTRIDMSHFSRAGLNQKGDAVFGRYRWDAPAKRGPRPAPVDLSPWIGGMGFQAEAINDEGAVAGSMTTDETHGTTVPFLLQNRKLTTLVSAPRKGSSGAAHAISNRGEVVGESDDRPFRWLSGILTLLPQPGPKEPADRRGPPRGTANAVNAEGLIVGASDGSGRRHAVLWQAEHVYDLNTLIDPDAGWTLEEATGINREGQICGNGTLHGSAYGFLLTPRPRAVR